MTSRFFSLTSGCKGAQRHARQGVAMGTPVSVIGVLGVLHTYILFRVDLWPDGRRSTLSEKKEKKRTTSEGFSAGAQSWAGGLAG